MKEKLKKECKRLYLSISTAFVFITLSHLVPVWIFEALIWLGYDFAQVHLYTYTGVSFLVLMPVIYLLIRLDKNE